MSSTNIHSLTVCVLYTQLCVDSLAIALSDIRTQNVFLLLQLLIKS